MVNLDQAKKNVQNAQNQLDQALKELEKAKKPKAWERVYPNGAVVAISQFPSPTWESQEWWDPCKVTVRPLGGPEPVVFESYIVRSDMSILCELRGKIVDEGSNLGRFLNKRVRVTVEEIE